MPSLLNKSCTITAKIDVPEGADGMIYNQAGRFLGYGLYLLKGKPAFTYKRHGIKRTPWEGPALSAGKHTIVFDCTIRTTRSRSSSPARSTSSPSSSSRRSSRQRT